MIYNSIICNIYRSQVGLLPTKRVGLQSSQDSNFLSRLDYLHLATQSSFVSTFDTAQQIELTISERVKIVTNSHTHTRTHARAHSFIKSDLVRILEYVCSTTFPLDLNVNVLPRFHPYHSDDGFYNIAVNYGISCPYESGRKNRGRRRRGKKNRQTGRQLRTSSECWCWEYQGWEESWWLLRRRLSAWECGVCGRGRERVVFSEWQACSIVQHAAIPMWGLRWGDSALIRSIKSLNFNQVARYSIPLKRPLECDPVPTHCNRRFFS